MDFFGALQRLIINRFVPEVSATYGDGYFVGVTTIIEALKEMMVGEPLVARLRHKGRISATPYTVVEFKPGRQIGIGGLEHIHIDGEEVVVMVFKKS